MKYSSAANDIIKQQALGKKGKIFINGDKSTDPLVYINLDVDGQKVPLFEHRLNAYEDTYRLLAMMGIPFNVGEEPKENIFTNKLSPELDKWWNSEVTEKNIERRPVTVFNGFGRESSPKGFKDVSAFSKAIRDMITKGYFVVVLPNDHYWGTIEIAEKFVANVPNELQKFFIIAPGPKSQPLLHKYISAKSDLVVTVEGGMMHLAYNQGKPLIAIKMPFSGDFNKWLSYARSARQIWIKSPDKLGESIEGINVKESEEEKITQKTAEQAQAEKEISPLQKAINDLPLEKAKT